MTNCSACGASLNDGTVFCAFCGAQQTRAIPSGGPARAPVLGPQSSGMSSNIAGALAYPLGFITGILFLNMGPYRYDPFVRFHAWQSIFLSCCYFVFFMGWSMLTGMLFAARLGFVFTVLAPVVLLLRLACILLGFFLMYKAFKNERFSLPFIGRMAAQQAG